MLSSLSVDAEVDREKNCARVLSVDTHHLKVGVLL